MELGSLAPELTHHDRSLLLQVYLVFLWHQSLSPCPPQLVQSSPALLSGSLLSLTQALVCPSSSTATSLWPLCFFQLLLLSPLSHPASYPSWVPKSPGVEPRPQGQPRSAKTCISFSFLLFLSSFLIWAIFKVFIGFVIILLLLYVLVFWPWGM